MNRLIQLLDERQELIVGDDGYVILWPDGRNGAFTAVDLRLIADEIDKRNAKWHKQVMSDPRINP